MKRAARKVAAVALMATFGVWPSQTQAAMTVPNDVISGVLTPTAPVTNVTANPAPARFPQEFRSIDGTGNNAANAEWGSAGVTLLRRAPADYGDGAGSPSGADRPVAREISNVCMAQTGSAPSPAGISDFVWQWGQFLDHDISLTPAAAPAESFDIPVPAGDPWFDPSSTGTQIIPLDRSLYTVVGGVRQQVNAITAYIDASNVYGSDTVRARELRTLDGTGRLETSTGNLLPFNTAGLPNAPSSDPAFFLAGDVRANEQVGLTSMHTLFVREHNRRAMHRHRRRPNMSDEGIYQRTRAVVVAEMQAITFGEFLPVLLGPGAIPPYGGYDPSVNAGIDNAFSTAAYRFGHSMLSATLMRLGSDGQVIPEGNLSLADAFFHPQEVVDTGIEPLLRGLCTQVAQEIDAHVVDPVRNFLFGPAGAGGLDLASLNIQRGRDHGLPSYNQARVAWGLAPATSFADINPDAAVQADLAAVYASVDDVDLWVGGLSEPHVAGGHVGETFRAILVDQFPRLRNGDRFWYESYFRPRLVRRVERQTLARVIRRNTTIGGEIGTDVFQAPTTP